MKGVFLKCFMAVVCPSSLIDAMYSSYVRARTNQTRKNAEEFHRQGDLEAEKGVPVSPLCSREGHNQAKSQCDFVNFVVRPCAVRCLYVNNTSSQTMQYYGHPGGASLASGVLQKTVPRGGRAHGIVFVANDMLLLILLKCLLEPAPGRLSRRCLHP